MNDHYYSQLEVIKIALYIINKAYKSQNKCFEEYTYHFSNEIEEKELRYLDQNDDEYKNILIKKNENDAVISRVRDGLEAILKKTKAYISGFFEYYPNQPRPTKRNKEKPFFNRFEMKFLVFSIIMKIEKRNNVIFDLLSINNNNIDTKCAIDYIDELINFLYDMRFDNNGEWFEYERTFLDSDEIIQTEINHNEEVFCLYLSYIQRRYILLEMFNEIGKSFADTLIPVEELRNIPNLYKFDPHPEMKGYTTLIKHGILKSFPYENACGLIDDLESHIVKYVNDYFKSDDFKDVHDKHYPEILSWLNSESDNNVMDDLNNSCLDIKDEYTEKGFGETKLKKREQSTKA